MGRTPLILILAALAWLVTGQGLNNTGRVDYGALSAASAALMGKGGKPFTAGIAQRFGLDDISLKSVGTSGAQGTASQVVVFAEDTRVSEPLLRAYEIAKPLRSFHEGVAARLGIGCTVHAAIGAEIIHQHPAANGAAIGDTSHRDFRWMRNMRSDSVPANLSGSGQRRRSGRVRCAENKRGHQYLLLFS